MDDTLIQLEPVLGVFAPMIKNAEDHIQACLGSVMI
jgi:hypothetical protein